MSQRILIVGATSAIVQVAIRHWAGQGASLYLLARDEDKLKAVAADAKTRGADVKTAAYNTDLSITQLTKLVDKTWAAWDGFDGALLAHGWLPNQQEVQDNPATVAEVTHVNGTSAVQLLALLAPRFAGQKHGWLAAITSVAGDRGRAKMYVYGGAKALLQHWLEGLRQRLSPLGVRVIDIRFGPVDTPMTHGLKMPLMTDAETVGAGLVKACARANGAVYLPGIWRWIMLLLKSLPTFIWVRMKI